MRDQVEIIFGDELVRSIIVADPKSGVTMADIVAKHGLPEYMGVSILYSDVPDRQAVLAYPSKGMAFATYYDGSTPYSRLPKPLATKTDVVIWRDYYEPTTLEELKHNRYLRSWDIPLGRSVEWEDIPDSG